MRISFKRFLLMTATGIILSSTPALAKTAAIVNGEEITSEEVQAAYETLPKEDRRPLNEIYDAVIGRIVDQRLVEQAAEKSGIAKEPAIKKNLERIVKRLLREEYLRREVEKKVSDSDVKKKYDEIAGGLKGQQEIKARHILVDTEAQAKDIVKELESGKDFIDLAKKKSKGPSAERGGDLGYFVRSAMVPDFANAAFNLKVGDYTKTPVQTRFGWHIIRVEDKRNAVIPKFEDVKEQVRRGLSDQVIGEILQTLRKDAKIDIKK